MGKFAARGGYSRPEEPAADLDVLNFKPELDGTEASISHRTFTPSTSSNAHLSMNSSYNPATTFEGLRDNPYQPYISTLNPRDSVSAAISPAGSSVPTRDPSRDPPPIRAHQSQGNGSQNDGSPDETHFARRYSTGFHGDLQHSGYLQPSGPLKVRNVVTPSPDDRSSIASVDTRDRHSFGGRETEDSEGRTDDRAPLNPKPKSASQRDGSESPPIVMSANWGS
jgi:hypothetical protein